MVGESEICHFGGLGGPGCPGGPRRPLQRVVSLPHTFWNARMHLCFANVVRYPCCQNVPLCDLGPLPLRARTATVDRLMTGAQIFTSSHPEHGHTPSQQCGCPLAFETAALPSTCKSQPKQVPTDSGQSLLRLGRKAVSAETLTCGNPGQAFAVHEQHAASQS